MKHPIIPKPQDEEPSEFLHQLAQEPTKYGEDALLYQRLESAEEQARKVEGLAERLGKK